MPNSDFAKPSERQEQILQALAAMLEEAPAAKITTAKLAACVGVSEAALYRHFPSKTRMFEALIAFAEDTLFIRVSRISEERVGAVGQCYALTKLYLEFCEKNPGITQLLTARALTGESGRLHQRVAQLYERLETQLRQYLREAELREGQRPRLPVNTAANLLLASAEGRVNQFCRSDFKRLPTEGWQEQWRVLTADLMAPVPRLSE
ncbi:MAG: nucleoid occlusion factor SlmA [Luminiphilus sp.]|jgi:TetR/AcrR family transcriptional regulator|nr:nucleoid occlusion factor SlmA [Luminiphilus sp.]